MSCVECIIRAEKIPDARFRSENDADRSPQACGEIVY